MESLVKVATKLQSNVLGRLSVFFCVGIFHQNPIDTSILANNQLFIYSGRLATFISCCLGRLVTVRDWLGRGRGET